MAEFQFTPTWVVGGVSFVIILISLVAERGLHKLGKFLKHSKQDALFDALQKLKEELMLLGFISLLLTAFQSKLSSMCVPPHVITKMLPCKRPVEVSESHVRRMLSDSSLELHCSKHGKVTLISLEALHQLHIFIFVMALMHVLFCVTTMVLGGARVREWKKWEDSLKTSGQVPEKQVREYHHHFVMKYARGHWSQSLVFSWLVSFFRQFSGGISKSDYIVLRQGFVSTHCPRMQNFDFHKYMLRTLEIDFRKIISISWYLWLFVVVFLVLNIKGWNTFFWMAFIPLILLLIVGAKMVNIITLLAKEVAQRSTEGTEAARVEPTDKHFWFEKPTLILHLIHFILFQNAFEIAFFVWILFTYGVKSCMIEKTGFVVTRLLMGIVVQVLCSYSTFPLYILVSQMGTKFKKGMFDDFVQAGIEAWLGSLRGREAKKIEHTIESSQIEDQEMFPIQGSQNTINYYNQQLDCTDL